MTDPRKRVINTLKEEFDVFKIERLSDSSEERIKVYFDYNGQRAFFIYNLIGLEIGIDECTYEESDNEDIYGLIHDWIGEHIGTKTKISFDNQEIGYGGILEIN